MSMPGTNGKPRRRLQWTTATSVGTRVRLLYVLLLLIYPTHIYPLPTGRPLYAELSPVTDFREACCRQNENGECNRGGFCNFMHLRLPTPDLAKQLKHGQRVERKMHPPKTEQGGGWEPSKREGGRGRSASPGKRGGRDAGEDRWTRK